jgi:hypothetical protein
VPRRGPLARLCSPEGAFPSGVSHEDAKAVSHAVPRRVTRRRCVGTNTVGGAISGVAATTGARQRAWGENAVVEHEINPRPRGQGSEPFEQIRAVRRNDVLHSFYGVREMLYFPNLFI